MWRSSACGCSSSRSPSRPRCCALPDGRRSPSCARSAAPPTIKKLLVLTLSLIETILHAVDRARAALIAAGIITRAHSWRNLRNGWVLVQTVWLTVLTIAIGRMRDKWPIEGTLARLDGALAAPPQRASPPPISAGSRSAIAALVARWGCAEWPSSSQGRTFPAAAPRCANGCRRSRRARRSSSDPYAEAALSGLSSTVADEIAIYAAARLSARRRLRRSISPPRDAQAADVIRRRAGAARAALLLALGLSRDRRSIPRSSSSTRRTARRRWRSCRAAASRRC